MCILDMGNTGREKCTEYVLKGAHSLLLNTDDSNKFEFIFLTFPLNN